MGGGHTLRPGSVRASSWGTPAGTPDSVCTLRDHPGGDSLWSQDSRKSAVLEDGLYQISGRPKDRWTDGHWDGCLRSHACSGIDGFVTRCGLCRLTGQQETKSETLSLEGLESSTRDKACVWDPRCPQPKTQHSFLSLAKAAVASPPGPSIQ